MAETDGLAFNEIKDADKHGLGAKCQSSDNTGADGHLGKFKTGILTDNGNIDCFITAAGTVNAYTATLTPAVTLGLGDEIRFKAPNTNTGAATLTLNGGSAIPIKKGVINSLSPGDIVAGQIIELVYDGTNWQIVSLGSDFRPYHMVFWLPDKPGAGAQVGQWTCPGDLPAGVTFDANFGGFAYGWLHSNPTATVTYSFQKVGAGAPAGTPGTAFGSLTISTAGVFTWSSSAVSFAAGETLTIWAPSTQDATLSSVGFVLPGKR